MTAGAVNMSPQPSLIAHVCFHGGTSAISHVKQQMSRKCNRTQRTESETQCRHIPGQNPLLSQVVQEHRIEASHVVDTRTLLNDGWSC